MALKLDQFSYCGMQLIQDPGHSVETLYRRDKAGRDHALLVFC